MAAGTVPAKRFARRFELAEPIKTGPYARAWRARDRTLGRDAFLKIHPRDLPPEAIQYLDYLDATRPRIAEAGSDVLVTPYATGVSAGSRYAASPFLAEHTDAAALIAAHRGMPPLLALRALHEVAGAIRLLHDRDIVHGDIKPANLMLDATRIDTPRLVDPGMARLITPTGPAVLAVTLRYLPPALLRPSLARTAFDGMTRVISFPATGIRRMPAERIPASAFGPSLDEYALGVTMFELLSGGGRLAFPPTRRDFVRQVLRGNPACRELPDGRLAALFDWTLYLLEATPERDGALAQFVATLAATLGDPDAWSAGASADALADRFLDQPPEARTAVEAGVEDALDAASGTLVRAVRRVDHLMDELDDSETLIVLHVAATAPGGVIALEPPPSPRAKATQALNEDVVAVIDEWKRRGQRTWQMSLAMIVVGYGVGLVILLVSVVLGLTTGDLLKGLVGAGVGGAALVTSLLWGPFDRLARANEFMTGLEIIRLDVRRAHAAGLDTAEGRRLFAEAKADMATVFARGARGHAEARGGGRGAGA
jgi:serine/threonine protein kinase